MLIILMVMRMPTWIDEYDIYIKNKTMSKIQHNEQLYILKPNDNVKLYLYINGVLNEFEFNPQYSNINKNSELISVPAEQLWFLYIKIDKYLDLKIP